MSLLENLQTHRAGGIEIIVCDGGSEDLTRDRAQPMADHVLSTKPGRSIQMNAGASVADGEWIAFVHADSGFDQAHLAALESAIQHRRDAVWGRFDVSIAGASVAFPVIALMMNWRSRITSVATGDQCMFVRRDVFGAVGGFQALALMEDVALSKTLRQRSAPLCISSPRVVTSGRRWDSQGVFRTMLLMWALRLGYVCGVSPERLAQWYRPHKP